MAHGAVVEVQPCSLACVWISIGERSCTGGVCRQRMYVDCDRLDILLFEVLQAVVHHFLHRSERRHALVSGCAGLEEFRDLGDVPAAEARAQIVGQIERKPVVDIRAREGTILLDGAENIARRMTGPAVPGALDQVSAPIPLLALARVRFVSARTKK